MGSCACLQYESNEMEDASINKALNRLIELQEQILLQLRDGMGMRLSPISDPAFLEDLIDVVDVKSILNISDSTLYRIKKSNLVRSVRIGRRTYYSMTEIKRIAAHFMK